jgi:hypothetical protein
MIDDDVTVSIRLIQVLRTYCGDLRPGPLADLSRSVAGGSYPWFKDEFASAVRAGAFKADTWAETIGGGAGGPMRTEQRAIWSAVFSGEPFPNSRASTASRAAQTASRAAQTGSRTQAGSRAATDPDAAPTSRSRGTRKARASR